jgi:hypothetical protein
LYVLSASVCCTYLLYVIYGNTYYMVCFVSIRVLSALLQIWSYCYFSVHSFYPCASVDDIMIFYLGISSNGLVVLLSCCIVLLILRCFNTCWHRTRNYR